VEIPRPIIVPNRAFLRRRGIVIIRYHIGTSAALRVAAMLQANGVDFVNLPPGQTDESSTRLKALAMTVGR
jgi:hypothetical protein